MKHVITVVVVLLITSSCKKNTPQCITSDTSDFKKSCCSSGASVKEYDFQGNQVYVFDPGTCGADQTSEVKNDKCGSLGFLGGITGNTKINGEDFSNAKYRKTVWSN